jgi:mRNA-degrading endonuclease RelE of RelBE toxin-antitoxin system
MPPDAAMATPIGSYPISKSDMVREELGKLPAETQLSIYAAMDGLERNPRPQGCTTAVIPPDLEYLTISVGTVPPYVLVYYVDEEHHKIIVQHLKPIRFSQVPAPHEPEWVSFKLEISEPDDQAFTVRPLDTPEGQVAGGASQLPYDDITLSAVLKVLEYRKYDPKLFTTAQTEALLKLGLLSEKDEHYYLKPLLQAREEIGKALFDRLLPGDSAGALRRAFLAADDENKAVALQLRIPEKADQFGRYPWELLHDGARHYAGSGIAEITRYITYGERARDLAIKSLPGRLLFISPHPTDLSELSSEERTKVWDALKPAESSGRLEFDELQPPTRRELIERLGDGAYHIIHFDGHGVFARRCPDCDKLDYPYVTACKKCGRPLHDVIPLGYLAFEDGEGKADFVRSQLVENLILGASDVRLVFLSACQSSLVQGESLFSGLGPALIRGGVPAVVAMQFSMPVRDAADFAGKFYKALVEGRTLTRAVAQARRLLFNLNADTWYVPTLYLRTKEDDEEGCLFTE